MSITNRSAIRNAINLVGTKVTIVSHSDNENPTYNADTQLPTYTSTNVLTRAEIKNVTQNQIKNLGGLVQLNDKQFIVTNDIDGRIGDDIIAPIAGGTELFRIIEVAEPRDKKIFFARRRKT